MGFPVTLHLGPSLDPVLIHPPDLTSRSHGFPTSFFSPLQAPLTPLFFSLCLGQGKAWHSNVLFMPFLSLTVTGDKHTGGVTRRPILTLLSQVLMAAGRRSETNIPKGGVGEKLGDCYGAVGWLLKF